MAIRRDNSKGLLYLIIEAAHYANKTRLLALYLEKKAIKNESELKSLAYDLDLNTRGTVKNVAMRVSRSILNEFQKQEEDVNFKFKGIKVKGIDHEIVNAIDKYGCGVTQKEMILISLKLKMMKEYCAYLEARLNHILNKKQ